MGWLCGTLRRKTNIVPLFISPCSNTVLPECEADVSGTVHISPTFVKSFAAVLQK